jgi:hypothetical protein
MMKAKCGHIVEKRYADAHDGLCRRCHSNFSFLINLESKYGEDAVVQYWYAREDEQSTDCLIEHLIDFYQRELIMVPSKDRYIKRMLYMLTSLLRPFDMKSLE